VVMINVQHVLYKRLCRVQHGTEIVPFILIIVTDGTHKFHTFQLSTVSVEGIIYIEGGISRIYTGLYKMVMMYKSIQGGKLRVTKGASHGCTQ
jgi:hypothetical protein